VIVTSGGSEGCIVYSISAKFFSLLPQ